MFKRTKVQKSKGLNFNERPEGVALSLPKGSRSPGARFAQSFGTVHNISD
jgi:hypothetical protein